MLLLFDSSAWLVLEEKSSLGVLNLESVLQEQRPRLTKCKDSGNDSVTFAATKKVCIHWC